MLDFPQDRCRFVKKVVEYNCVPTPVVGPKDAHLHSCIYSNTCQRSLMQLVPNYNRRLFPYGAVRFPYRTNQEIPDKILLGRTWDSLILKAFDLVILDSLTGRHWKQFGNNKTAVKLDLSFLKVSHTGYRRKINPVRIKSELWSHYIKIVNSSLENKTATVFKADASFMVQM